jgi:hypothetical protein
MLARKTTFVVGAGASSEVGLPLGSALMSMIANILRLSRGATGQYAGDQAILAALSQLASRNGRPIEDYLQAASLIRESMWLAPSIDNFINTHKNNKVVEECAKVAILMCILRAERDSGVAVREINPGVWNVLFQNITNSWFSEMFRIVVGGVTRDNVSAVLSNVSFVVFNYDLCVEQFLFHALMQYFSLSVREASDLMKMARIVHPYGSTGSIIYENNADRRGIGPEASGADLADLTPRVRTFIEGASDSGTTNAIHDYMREAECVLFLGFAYHEMNLGLLGPVEGPPKRVLGTARGISSQNLSHILPKVQGLFKTGVHCDVHQDLSAAQLLSTYSNFLKS